MYRLFFLFLLIFCFTAKAQFIKLHDFNPTDGENPSGDLILSGKVLYGLTAAGGAYGGGVIFKTDTDGTGYKKLYDFHDLAGIGPEGSLLLSDNILYGMTSGGGKYDYGVIFTIDTDGTGYKDIYNFNDTTGASPEGSLIISGTVLFGMTTYGGPADAGVIFKINTDGSGYDTLFSFSNLYGIYPSGSLSLSGSVLYGMANGGYNPDNYVFSMNTNGKGYSKIVNFNNYYPSFGPVPAGSLTLSGNELYGMTYSDGLYGAGNIFKTTITGTGFDTIMSFNGVNGENPWGSLTLSVNTLYGMTYSGGAYNYGVIFKMLTDGTGFTKLIDFDGSGKGNHPMGSLIFWNNALYGMTAYGGANGYGVIFKYTFSKTGLPESISSDNVYPNPTGGMLNINIQNLVKTDVLDAEGIYKGTWYGQKINLESLPAGIYFLKIYTVDGAIFKEAIILIK